MGIFIAPLDDPYSEVAVSSTDEDQCAIKHENQYQKSFVGKSWDRQQARGN